MEIKSLTFPLAPPLHPPFPHTPGFPLGRPRIHGHFQRLKAPHFRLVGSIEAPREYIHTHISSSHIFLFPRVSSLSSITLTCNLYPRVLLCTELTLFLLLQNYLGDWLMAWAWCLPTGFSTPITYFYVAYFAVLLVHRQRRDDEACQKKYGKDWDTYCEKVPYRIIPGIVSWQFPLPVDEQTLGLLTWRLTQGILCFFFRSIKRLLSIFKHEEGRRDEGNRAMSIYGTKKCFV